MKTYLIPALILLAACDPMSNPTEDPPDMSMPDLCMADGSQGLVGQPESVLAAMTFVEGTRIFRTGDALTMDFNPERLNIEIGPDGLIVAVSCG
jgi:hypothetical protein